MPRSTAQNQIQRIKTTVNENALGDFNIEHESTEQMTFGNVKWPIAWHSHQGWDDNWQFYSPEHRPQRLRRQVPERAAERLRRSGAGARVGQAGAARRTRAVTVEKMADGVYLLGGGPANSYMVEFRDFVAVFEAPGNEERSLAVIEQVAKLAPGKPIRWLISSHPHFDHIGGLRTYLHIGATIVTHMKQPEFLNRDVLTYKPRTVKPDIVSLWPPTEVAEGYNYEAIQENLRHHRQQPHPARLLRAAAAARRGHADGVPAGRADRVRGGPVRHARAAAGRADAGDAQLLQPGAAHEARRRHDRARARQAGSLEHVHDGAGTGGQDELK